MKTFHLGIKLTVTGHADEQDARALADATLQAFAAHHSFRAGSPATGRVFEHTNPSTRAKVTVDVFTQTTTADPSA